MGDRQSFSGIPAAGFGMYFLYGIVLFPAGALLLWMMWPRLFKDFCGSALGLFVLAFGILLLGLAADSLRLRTLEMDDLGLRMKKGKRVKWEVLWGEVRAIGTTSLGGKTPRTGFYIKTDNKYFHVNTRDDLGPREKLVGIFRLIATRCSGSNIYFNDMLGWATDLGLRFATPGPAAVAAANAQKGEWYDSSDPRRAVNAGLAMGLGTIAIGVVCLLLWYEWLTGLDQLPVVGLAFVIAGLIITGAVDADYRARPVAIRFEDAGLEMRFPSGGKQYVKWTEIKILGYDSESNVLRIRAGDGKRIWVGFFSPAVGESVSTAYAATRDKSRPPPPLDQ